MEEIKFWSTTQYGKPHLSYVRNFLSSRSLIKLNCAFSPEKHGRERAREERESAFSLFKSIPSDFALPCCHCPPPLWTHRDGSQTIRELLPFNSVWIKRSLPAPWKRAGVSLIHRQSRKISPERLIIPDALTALRFLHPAPLSLFSRRRLHLADLNSICNVSAPEPPAS